MIEEVSQELWRIRAMPYGTARTSAAEAAARRIEAEGPQEKLAEALLDLVEAYTFTGRGDQAFVAFARTLRHWDAHPELFDPGDERNLFWEFKWIAADLPDFPRITRPQAEAMLDDMERRFALRGSGTSAVAMSRFGWAWHSGDPDAERARIAWITMPRDAFDDCRACGIGQQVDFFTEQGRWEEAVALGLTQDASCNIEPAKTRHALALSALMAGDLPLAARSHRLALASLDGSDRDIAQSHGQGFEFLARGGHLERALRSLRSEHAELLERAPSPLSRLRFLLGVLAGLAANRDRGETPTGLGAGRATVSELRGWVEGVVDELVAAFDARGGTDYYARLAARARAAERAGVLDLGASGDAAGPRAPGAGASPGPGGSPDPGASAGAGAAPPAADVPAPGRATVSEADPESALAHAEALAAQREYAAAVAPYLTAAAGFEAAGWLERAGLAAAEAAQCAALCGDDPEAHAAFRSATGLLRAAGGDAEARVAVLAAWAPVAVRMADPVPQIVAARTELAAHGAFDAEGLSDELAQRRRTAWRRRRAVLRDALARVVASADPAVLPSGIGPEAAVEEAHAAGEEFAALGLIADAAHAFWAAGRVQRERGDLPGAVWSLESAYEGFGAAGQSEPRLRAAGELIEVLRASGQSDRAEALTAELLR
ncbi:hypothetical protein MUN77_07355 [Leucobacter allii]|uniref:hypothetical protein n=1 Tax=Leucobacter allii TaxID=2932247 RepID=UPI001FD3D9CC|nr:hypothetical protein [Leucobacter allii]UOR03103.1 hypothetical protein MUN77_07355 [Leucobacter allii]